MTADTSYSPAYPVCGWEHEHFDLAKWLHLVDTSSIYAKTYIHALNNISKAAIITFMYLKLKFIPKTNEFLMSEHTANYRLT